METFFSYVSVGAIVNVGIFATTLIFSDKIKDFFKGVPAHTRATLKQVEAGLTAKVTAYEQTIVGDLIPAAKTPLTATVTALLPIAGTTGPTGPAA